MEPDRLELTHWTLHRSLVATGRPRDLLKLPDLIDKMGEEMLLLSLLWGSQSIQKSSVSLPGAGCEPRAGAK